MQIIDSIPVWGDADTDSLDQLRAAITHGPVVRAALMADHHLGYSVPIGAAIAYNRAVCVNGVGFDIGCGNKAVLTTADADTVRHHMPHIMDTIYKHISFGVGRKNNQVVNHELFDDPVWGDIDILASLKSRAREQLGTVGSGNHYVDVFVDDTDRIWIGVHFGSRGLGHSICTHFIKAAGGKDGIHATPIILHEDSDLGEQYLKCMHMAGRYAYAGRDWVCAQVARILDAGVIHEVHNHHNFAWKERHNNQDLWVVRKGSTPNHPGIQSFVGGSMGDFSFILQGVDCEESKTSLYSTIHGAGRAMGRKAALKNIKPQDMQAWITRFDVQLRGAGLDEAPQCYKRIDNVLFSHRNTVKILNTLKPLGVAMASAKEFDPYKD